MQLSSGSIPQLMNGVSQQPASLRLASQGEQQVNCMSSVVDGLGRRPPTNHIAKISNTAFGNAYLHTINRDSTERYTVILKSGSVQVFDMSGTAMTVNTPDGTAYLTSSDPKNDFFALTIEDYTFIVNRSKTVAMDTTTSGANGSEAIVYIKGSTYSAKYEITINGTSAASYTTSATVAASLQTSDIAAQLVTLLTASLGAGWTIDCSGSVIHIKNTAGTAFTIQTSDSGNNTYMQLVGSTLAKFTDLPGVAPNGYIVKIVGSTEGVEDDYYVKFVTNDQTLTFADGSWVETIAPAIEYKFDASTMPFQLVRTGVGVFQFRKTTWDNRLVGDTTTNPNPSFVGSAINSLFLYKGRLCFLSDENYIMSEADNYFNFWRTTIRQLLSTDPIDKSPGHTKVSILEYGLPFNKTLLAFSEQTQFLDTTDGVLSPQNAALSPTTEFEAKLTARPVAVGRNIYFPVERGDYTGIKELFVDSAYNTVDVAETTSHVPQYIPKNVFRLAGSSNENILLALSSDNQNRVYVNNFYFGPGAGGNLTKLQNAWHYWELPSTDTVLSVDFIESTIYFVIDRADGSYLESMNIAAGAVESGFDFLMYLDRKVSLTGVYNAGTNLTTWTLPYADTGTFMVIRGSAWPSNMGLPILSLSHPTSTTITVTGDFSAHPCVVGRTYEQRYRFSQQFVKDSQGQAAINLAFMQMKTFQLRYNKTGYFRVEVTPSGRNTYTYVFNARVIGSPNDLIGVVSLEEGDFKFPVYARNDQVTIDIINDSYLPLYLLSAEWEASIHLRSRRV